MKTHQLFVQCSEQVKAEQQLLVAYSGGLDSSVLLHLMVRLRQERPDLVLRAVHIHHGLNPLADAWAVHCQQQCAEWEVPFIVHHVHVNRREGGVEAAARAARYAAFKKTLIAKETLLTAQHLNDQCETFLLALKRGSGPAGLSAMAEKSNINTHRLLRPLLHCSRQHLEHYAREQQLRWINDNSNQDPRFDRNFLRLTVLPLLEKRWPSFASTTARSASLCAEQEQLLDELLTEQLSSLLNADNALSINGLMDCSPVRRYALLRRWMALWEVTLPTRVQLQKIWHEVALSREDAEPKIQWGNIQVRRFRQHLYILPLMTTLYDVQLDWTGETPLTLPDGVGVLSIGEKGSQIRTAGDKERITVRFFAQGRVRIAGRCGSRPIKKIWQELGIPPWQRERIPLIYYNEHLIAAGDVFVTQEGLPKDHQQSWQLNWQR